jgi:hypothetical protein
MGATADRPSRSLRRTLPAYGHRGGSLPSQPSSRTRDRPGLGSEGTTRRGFSQAGRSRSDRVIEAQRLPESCAIFVLLPAALTARSASTRACARATPRTSNRVRSGVASAITIFGRPRLLEQPTGDAVNLRRRRSPSRGFCGRTVRRSRCAADGGSTRPKLGPPDLNSPKDSCLRPTSKIP